MARMSKEQIAANELAATQLKAEQQAELKRLRAEKRAQAKAAKANVAAHVAGVQPEVTHTDIEMLMDGIELPSVKRVLVGFILGVAAAGATGYGISVLLAYALAGIMVLTAAPWLAFVLSALAWVIAIYAGWKLGGYVGGKVFASVVMPEGLASRSYASVVNAVTGAKQNVVGMFSVNKEEMAQQVFAKFTGAHHVPQVAA